MPTPPKTGRKVGCPTKKNEAIIERLITCAALGLPIRIVAQRCGISAETLCQWRSKDADLDRRLDEARAEAAEAAWRKIMEHGESGAPNSWMSVAWRLERSHPESFARPEIQLSHQHFVQTNTHNSLSVTISGEAANALQARSEKVSTEVEKLFKDHTARLTNSAPPDDNNNW
jgi:hypothetical protein